MKNFMEYNFDIKNIILACFVAAGKGTHIHNNRPSHGLALHLGGDKDYIFSDKTVLRVRKNDIIYLPKHSYYSVKTTLPGDCYAINFDVPENLSFRPFVFRIKNTQEFHDAFKSAEHFWKLKKPGFELKCKSELYNILYNMQKEANIGYVSSDKFNIIRPAVDYIHKNFTSHLINISDLAGMCNITPEYFRSIFKSFYGISPVKYINDLKITRAKELISSGMYSLSDCAELSGYTDMSHFSREFKKKTGICPSEYNKL